MQKRSSERQCRGLIQDPITKKQTGPRCLRRKVFDDEKPQANKTRDDIIADELCKQHKLMKEKFAEMIVQQLLEEQQWRSSTAILAANPLANHSAIRTPPMPRQPGRPLCDPFPSTRAANPVANIFYPVPSMANTQGQTTVPSQQALIQDCLRLIDEHYVSIFERTPDNGTITDKDQLVEDMANALADLLMDESDEDADGGEEVTSGGANARTEEEELWDQIT